MKLGMNQRGLLALADLIGLDDSVHIMASCNKVGRTIVLALSALQRAYVAAGWLGRKSADRALHVWLNAIPRVREQPATRFGQSRHEHREKSAISVTASCE